MFRCTSATTEIDRIVALNIITEAPTVFGGQLLHYLGVLHQNFSDSLAQSRPFALRFATIEAVVSIMHVVKGHKDQIAAMGTLMPMIVQFINDALPEHDELAQQALEALIDLAEEIPTVFRRILPDIVHLLVRIMLSQDTDESVRQLASELIVVIAENASPMCRKSDVFCSVRSRRGVPRKRCLFHWCLSVSRGARCGR